MKTPQAALVGLALALAPLAARADSETLARPDRVESDARPPPSVRMPLILGGLGLTAGVWAVNFGSSYMFEGEPGYSHVRTPIIGPWQALANNTCDGSCSFINYFNYIYFTMSGLAQAGGLGIALEGLLVRTAVPGATPPPAPRPAPRVEETPGPTGPSSPPPPTSPSKPLFFLPTPITIGQGGVGVSFGGIF